MGDMNINPNIHTVKLDGTKKTIDMTKLEGLRITDQNRSIFGAVYDLNNDGKTSDKEKALANQMRQIMEDGVIKGEAEVKIMQQWLDTMDGSDSKIGKRDFHSNKNVNEAAFGALQSLADQQAALHGNLGVYEEGNTTIYRDSETGLTDKTITTKDEQTGTTTLTTEYGDGGNSTEVITKDGDKTYTYVSADGASQTLHTSAGSNLVDWELETIDGKSTYTTRTQDENGVTALIYNGTDATGELTGVELPASGGGITQITDIQAGEDGVYTGKIGEEEVQFKLVNGKVELIENKPVENNEENEAQTVDNGTTSYSIKKGDTLEKIARRHLREQLGTEPTARQVYEYYNQIAQENGIKNVNKIYVGKTLTLPAVEGAKPPIPVKSIEEMDFGNPPATVDLSEVPKTIELEQFEVDKANAGQTVQVGERWINYDDQGRVSIVFDHEPSHADIEDAFGASIAIKYNDDGSIYTYTVFDSKPSSGSSIVNIRDYKADGNLRGCGQMTYDPNTSELKKIVTYNSDGTYYGTAIDIQNNGNGEVRYAKYSDGALILTADENHKVTWYREYDKDGNVIVY